VRKTPLETYKGILEKSPYLSIPMIKVNAAFGFSAGLLGAGVGSGVETGTGVDFRARRPDCPITPRAHNAASAAYKVAA
jgi:hypothetical protein